MPDIYQRLDDVLAQYSDDEAECILGVSELDGFLHALACSPQPLSPAVWLPAIWGGEVFAPVWPSSKQADAFTADVMTLYSAVVETLNRGECEPVWLEHEERGRIVTVVDEWCEGFCLGMQLWGDELEELLAEILEPILFFTVDLDAPDEAYERRAAMSQQAMAALQQQIPAAVFELRAHCGLPGVTFADDAKPAAGKGKRSTGNKRRR